MRKPRLMTPGPAMVPEDVLLELARPVIHHRSDEAKKVIVIQLDPSRVPPEMLRKLMELSRTPADDRKGEKGRKGDGDREKAEKARKGDDDHEKKGEKARKGDGDRENRKPNVVQVDLNKLSPELARRLKEELSRQKGGR